MPAETFPEVIGMADAARVSGRTARTIRRWIAEGHLTDRRADGDKTSALRLRTSELRAFLATLPPPPPGAGGTCPPSPGGRDEAASSVSAPAPPSADLAVRVAALEAERAELRERLADARELVADLRRTRDLQAERISRIEAERVELLAELREARGAVEAVQRASADLAVDLVSARATVAALSPEPDRDPGRPVGRVRALLRAVWPRAAGDRGELHAAH